MGNEEIDYSKLDDTNNGELIPNFRKVKYEKGMDELRSWKAMGLTKEEALERLDRRAMNNSDVDEVYGHDQKEDDDTQDLVSDYEDKNQEKEENTSDELEGIEDIFKTQNEIKEDNNEPETQEEKEAEKNISGENDDKEIQNETQTNDKINLIPKTNPNGNQYIELTDDELEDFPENDQIFHRYNEQEEEEMINSIKLNGIIQPIIVRKLNDGKYQILAGHNRRRCGRKAGLIKYPCIVKNNLTDAEAEIYLIDTNLATRENLSPMEKARALLKRKNLLSSREMKKKIQEQIINDNKESNQGKDILEKIQKEENMSRGNIQRYLRLNELDKSLQDIVDNKGMNLKVAENLSFLKKPEQKAIAELLNNKIKISEKQARDLKNDEDLSVDKIKQYFEKKEIKQVLKVTLTENELKEIYDLSNFDNVQELKEKIIEDLKKINNK